MCIRCRVMVWKCICCCNSPKSVLRPCAILCHPKPNSLTVSENAQIRFILRFILLFSGKRSVHPHISTVQTYRPLSGKIHLCNRTCTRSKRKTEQPGDKCIFHDIFCYIVLRMQNNKNLTGQEMEYLPDKM